MKNKKGLSLIEILVALIIIGIIAACVSAAIISGYSMLKKAEHKSRAMSITHVKLQEYMAKSFDELVENDSGDDANISSQFKDTQDNTFFNWTVKVEDGFEGNLQQVPYKNITVETIYTERDPRAGIISSRTVRLANMVAYPLVHILSRGEKFAIGDKTREAPKTKTGYHDGMTDFQYNWTRITNSTGNTGLLRFDYRVRKDVVVMYNLAIFYDTNNKPLTNETVYTRCVLDGNPNIPHGIITRTPIMTQVFINNILELENVTRGNHTLNVEWAHDSATTRVWLRAYDVTVLAVESK
jgi:prepilin-type N-terminal cleavage/methylation domain-containing protein